MHTEPSYARNFVLGGGFRAYIVFMGILLLLAALLLVTGLIWGDPPARHANVENPGGSSPPVVGC